MVYRDIEEPLHLLGVKIHREHPAHPSSVEQVGDELCRDRNSRLIFPVLPRVTEKRNHGGDPIRARPPRGVHHDQQFHQMLIGRGRGGLNDENIAAANVLIDLDVGLSVGKRADGRLSQRSADVVANPLRQLAVGGAAEDLHLGLKRKHDFEGRLT